MKTVIAIVAVLVIAGGGYALMKNSDGDSKTNANSASMKEMPADTDATGEDTKAVATDVVKISDFAFTPVNITVQKGDTVTWTNEDNVAHTVTESDDRDGPKSDELQKGDTYTFTFNDVGTFKYKCSLHPNMTGTVTVTE
jgi:plastocyanin